MIMLDLYLRVYGVLALSHIVLHAVLGHIHHLRRRPRTALANLPSTTVIVPVYNEDPELLEHCLTALDEQEHPAKQVIVVDDGSPNLGVLEPVYARFAALAGWTVLRLTTNVGKRAAQRIGFDAATSDVVVTVDSDTQLVGPDALSMLTRSFLRRRVAAVTGAVGVSNANTNLLTRLTALRYWMAFHQERAAQSLFGVMLCCSGPFSAYRRSVVMEVLDDYVEQSFLGQPCTFGDDRHLTNLVLSRGHQAIFDPDAHVVTHVPDTWSGFLRQQARWNKSFYRELLWSMRFAHRRNPYLALELTLQTMLPFMLLGALASVAWRAVSDPAVAGVYAAIVVAIALLRCSYGVLRTRNLRFLLFTAYGFIHVGLLLPVRLYALSTMGRTHWGTRGMHRTGPAAQLLPPAEVLHARPSTPLPQQRTRETTVMTVSDTRFARNAVDTGSPTESSASPPTARNVLPALERTPWGGWRPKRSAASTVVVVPRQRTAGDAADIEWARWSLAVGS
jgi:cellulose synthase/poly-beta-1,6-N-acetylglucosamine synthase-like glycosyltransferase